MKPIFKISIIAGVIAVIGVGIYFAWNRAVAPIATAPNTTGTSPALPEAREGENETNNGLGGTSPVNTLSKTDLRKISDGPVFDFWIMPDSDEVYYFAPDGQVLSAKDGPDLPISNQTIKALNFISVGPGNKKILAAFGAPTAPQWGVFDLLDQAWRPLSSNIVFADWGTTEDKLVAQTTSGAAINLAQIDLSKTPPAYQTLIKDFRMKNISFSVMPDQRIMITEKPSATYNGSVWRFDPKTASLNLLESPTKGLLIRWSDDKTVAFQFSSPGKFLILKGDLSQQISDVFKSLPSKCNTAQSTIYCFEPQNLPLGSLMPDDYLQEKFYSTDSLFSISLGINENGKIFGSGDSVNDISKILTSGIDGVPALDVKNPKIMKNTVYFINRYDNHLYELKLSTGQ
ncbi:MAG: hypothetical protein UY23_C0001G0178 [Candidatus Jorgensenbacteria bacterium GW2011_GWA1_48_11]|uniref:Uncharacterized protein n=1 Tax=Candidatus Jorgensenbacteria bacterium GW2011_GWA1_48_11 TaxID=1618660 RepID=A0A0G1UBR7_9BACT|nr:MAG: hypothetical protein UY23_C0001G0178 [Candidatus Jorgensenbacteria bacterium GW2011_GWA1_48_11]KKW12065.1 MAG: hypothetical protein UY51_C0005G0307 [Candidatus Jorgensenbacteria bacterium GW2011_GWB1_49_9]